MGKLDGKVALVTGAGQGVGRGIAVALAAEGAQVAVAGRTAAKLEDSCRQIQDGGGEARPYVVDVSKAEQLKPCVSSVIRDFGGLHILVNNAQEVPLGTLLELKEEHYLQGMESGPHACFRLMRACYPELCREGGVIINLGTAAAIRPDPVGYGAYAAAKEAIRALTRAAACEWGPVGIRVNCILPLAMSPGMEQWIKGAPDQAESFLRTVPLGRIGDCERDIGRVVVFLCSEEGNYITGHSLPVDGGQAFMR